MFEKVWYRTIRKEWELFWSITSNNIIFSGKRNKHHTSVKLLLRKEITLQVFETQEAQKQLFGYGSSLFNAIHQTVFWILLQCIACSFLLATAPSDQFHLKSKKKKLNNSLGEHTVKIQLSFPWVIKSVWLAACKCFKERWSVTSVQ